MTTTDEAVDIVAARVERIRSLSDAIDLVTASVNVGPRPADVDVHLRALASEVRRLTVSASLDLASLALLASEPARARAARLVSTHLGAKGISTGSLTSFYGSLASPASLPGLDDALAASYVGLTGEPPVHSSYQDRSSFPHSKGSRLLREVSLRLAARSALTALGRALRNYQVLPTDMAPDVVTALNALTAHVTLAEATSLHLAVSQGAYTEVTQSQVHLMVSEYFDHFLPEDSWIHEEVSRELAATAHLF